MNQHQIIRTPLRALVHQGLIDRLRKMADQRGETIDALIEEALIDLLSKHADQFSQPEQILDWLKTLPPGGKLKLRPPKK